MAARDLEELKQQVAEFERQFSLPPSEWGRKITSEEIQYLKDHYYYLQVVASAGGQPLTSVELITAKSSDWNIIDYGDAMGSSVGEFIFSCGYFKDDTPQEGDDDGGTLVSPGKGTLINQAFLTAQEMIEMAIARGWRGAHIVAGHPLMTRSAWIAAEKGGLRVTGFEPGRKDQRIKRLVSTSSSDFKLKFKNAGGR